MSTFIFPPLPNILQNRVPERIISDADIDPVLLGLQQHLPLHPLPPPSHSPLATIRPPSDADIDRVLLALQPPLPLHPVPLSSHLPPATIQLHSAGWPAQPQELTTHSSRSVQQQTIPTISQPSTVTRGASSGEESPPPQATPPPSIASRSASNGDENPFPPTRSSALPNERQTIPAITDNHSWAGRNPSRPVIEPRPRALKLTNAQKASRTIARELKQSKANALNNDIKAYLEEQTCKMEELAAKNNTTVEKVKAIVGVNTHYKKSRKPALHNAILHAQAERVNKGNI